MIRALTLSSLIVLTPAIIASDFNLKYFSDANHKKMQQFENAYKKDNVKTVMQMLANGDVRTEDAGLVFIDNRFDTDKSPNCIKVIAQRDPYAVWKAYQKACNEAVTCPMDYVRANKRGHLQNRFIRTCLKDGFIIPLKRYDVDVDYEKFKYAYVSLAHYLIFKPSPQNIATLKTLLEKGANPSFKAACPIFTNNINEKQVPIDLFTLIKRNSNTEVAAEVTALLSGYVKTPPDIVNQFYPDTPFYKPIK